MSGEQTGLSSDLSQDQHGRVKAYRYGQRLGDLRPFYPDVYSDPRQAEEDVQRRIVKAQLDLLLRFTGARYFDVDPDPDSWLDTFYVLAGTWSGRDAVIDEQLASIDQVLSQTGGPLWRPDLYLPLDEVRQTAMDAVPAIPEPAPTPPISTANWQDPRPVDRAPDEDPAAGYLRELHASRQKERESAAPVQSANTPPVGSTRRFSKFTQELSRTVRRPRPTDAHHDSYPPHQPVSGDRLQL